MKALLAAVLLFCLVASVAACASAPGGLVMAATPAAIPETPLVTSPPPATATVFPPATPTPTAAPVLPTPTPSPSPTPHPLAGVTLDGLSARDYPGGAVQILRLLATTDSYTRYYVAYPSDGLTITGIMQVPSGDGPFPSS